MAKQRVITLDFLPKFESKIVRYIQMVVRIGLVHSDTAQGILFDTA